MSQPRSISPSELQSLLESKPDLAVVDVRTPAEFAEVHAVVAVNHPLDQLNPESLLTTRHVSRDEPVYLLCRSGQRAGRAAEQLAAAGYQQPVVVAGGTLAWIQAGLPTHRGVATVISLERQVRIAAGLLVFAGVVLARFVHPGFLVIPAFVGAGLVFAGITDWCGMGLLLARLPWNRRPAG